jgi:hypothetical protein
MTTDVGTDAAAVSLDRETRIPPAGAAASSVMVPVADAPPVTEEGLIVSVATPGGLTVS